MVQFVKSQDNNLQINKWISISSEELLKYSEIVTDENWTKENETDFTPDFDN